MSRIIPDARRYFLAALAAIAALLVRKMLSPLLGTENPYITAWVAVALSGWYWGFGPSVVCTFISGLGVWYWFLPYFKSFTFQNPVTEISGMVLFLVLSGLMIGLAEANRKSKAEAEHEVAERRQIEDQLRRSRALLEDRVQERTRELNLTNQQLGQEAERVRAQAEWLDAANDAIFVGGFDEAITYWNKGAERLYGWTRAEAVGKSPHDLLHTEFPVPFAEINGQRQQCGWQGELVHTKRDGTKVTVASRWTALNDAHNNLTGWLEINRDITDRKAAEASRRLNAHLLKMQDEEHRRIARELHDSAGQMVIALMLNLGSLKASGSLSLEEARLLSDSNALLHNLNSELCAMSHLLHPPLLDDVGVWNTLEWYVDGFTKRSGITATLEGDSNFGRLNSDLEVVIFKVVQECLTNVHRHSGSPVATVRLLESFGKLRLEVQDRGRGVPTEKQFISNQDGSGLGLKEMRERVSRLGGNLSIESKGAGTTVVAIFPISKPATASHANQAGL